MSPRRARNCCCTRCVFRPFLDYQALTTAQLAAELGDLPAGSLYRHVAMLTRTGVLQVVAESSVRAVVERTYMLRVAAAQIHPDEAAAMTSSSTSRPS